MAVQLQLLLPRPFTPGWHPSDVTPEQDKGYWFPLSPSLSIPSSPQGTLSRTTGSAKVASAAHPGADSHHPKSHHLDLRGRSSSFAGCERQFSLNVNNKNNKKKRAILFSFGACNRLSWGRRVGFFAKGAALLTFGERLLRASCCVRLIPGLCESTASWIEREEARPRHPSGGKKKAGKT